MPVYRERYKSIKGTRRRVPLFYLFILITIVSVRVLLVRISSDAKLETFVGYRIISENKRSIVDPSVALFGVGLYKSEMPIYI